MLTLAAMVFGLVGYAQLPLDLMPDLGYPTLTVRTTLPGAAPEEVEDQVSRPVEEALSTVEGLAGIESRSRAGASDVVLEFAWGTPMSAASQDVRERLQTTGLPDGAARPLILRYDPSLEPILRIAVAPAKGEATDLVALREVAERTLKRQLEAVAGVAAVSVRGGLERRVRVEPREDWLAARGVRLEELSATLGAENVNVAGGIVREGEHEVLVRTLNELRDLDEVRDLEIRRADGSLVRVGDVAEVTRGTADREVVARLDGAEAVELEVYKEGDARIVDVARGVKALVREASETPSSGFRLVVLDDQARFIEEALDGLYRDAFLGGVLAVLVTFVFLRDWKATAIISTAIPVCLIVTFAAMYVGDISLNLMSLGGLALGVSMVIDSATVVLENIGTRIEAGQSREDAAVEGTAEVATAVFASVLTGIAVFLPIGFVEGVAGQVFGDLAMTVVFSLATSLVVALVLVPMLAAREWSVAQAEVERARDLPESSLGDAARSLRARWAWRKPWAWPWELARFIVHQCGVLAAVTMTIGSALVLRGIWRAVRWTARRFDAASLWCADRFLSVYARVEGVFGAGLARVLRRPGLVVTLGCGSLLLAGALFREVGAELLPDVRQGRFVVDLALPVGTPLTRTDAVAQAIEGQLRAEADVASVYVVAGAERRADARPDEGEHTARVLVQLRPGTPPAREDAVTARARTLAAAWTDLDARVRRPALFSFRTPLEVIVRGHDLVQLRAASDQAQVALRGVPGLVDVESSLERGYPEVRLRYDRARLAALGLSVGDVASTVRGRVQGLTPTRLAEGERRVDVSVRLHPDDRSSLGDLAALNVNPRLWPVVRLDSVATLEEGEGPSEVRRIDQERAVVVSAGLSGFDLAGASAAVEARLAQEDLPGVTWEVAGQKRELARGVRSLVFAFALALFLVYVIMASTFESLVDPLVILVSVPLAAVGVAFGLWATNTPVGVTAGIGIIVLAGVVVANAIVLVDAIQRLRAEGRPLDAAVQEAAAQRLRPILITALNSVIGLIPLAVASGAGAEMQRPMAITIIFGLASSTVLTLVVVPVVYRGVARLRGVEA
jgi:HAE1 family hydrophobic/amphiphilic exporter-1